jgi:hypothetical protein
LLNVDELPLPQAAHASTIKSAPARPNPVAGRLKLVLLVGGSISGECALCRATFASASNPSTIGRSHLSAAPGSGQLGPSGANGSIPLEAVVVTVTVAVESADPLGVTEVGLTLQVDCDAGSVQLRTTV